MTRLDYQITARCRPEHVWQIFSDLDRWAERFRTWADGGEPDDLPRISPVAPGPPTPRSCFVYMISGAKVRAPAAATALIERLG